MEVVLFSLIFAINSNNPRMIWIWSMYAIKNRAYDDGWVYCDIKSFRKSTNVHLKKRRMANFLNSFCKEYDSNLRFPWSEELWRELSDMKVEIDNMD